MTFVSVRRYVILSTYLTQTWNSVEKVALWSRTALRPSAPETSRTRPSAGCWLVVKAEECSEEAAVLGTGVPWDDLKGPPRSEPKVPAPPGVLRAWVQGWPRAPSPGPAPVSP